MSGMTTHLTASLRGDREAFGTLVRQYQNTVYAVVYSITGNLQQSEDLSQETFVTAWLQLRELKDETKFPAWLCGIARNLAQNWVRTNARQNTPVPQSELVELLAAAPEHDPAENSFDMQDRHAQAALVWEILRELPEQYREPLVLYYQQSQSVAEIAEALDLSEVNVRQRLSRGRSQLREEVAERIERVLAALQPDKMFYVTVLAALPVATMTTAQAVAATFAAVTGGTMTSGTVAGGSGGGTLGTAGGAVTFWGMILNILITVFWILFFPFVIVFSMVVNYAMLRDMPTVRSRRAHLKYHLTLIGVLFVILDCFFVMVMLASLDIIPKSAFSTGYNEVIIFSLFPIGGLISGIYARKLVMRVIEQDLGKRPAPDVPLEESPLSLRSVKRVVRFLMISVSVCITFFGGLFGGVLAVASFPVSPLAACGAGIVTLVVIAGLIYLLVRFLQLPLAMATEDGLLRYPPKETYTVLKFKPDRWWRPEPEKPLMLRDYLVTLIPGVIFTMMLLGSCQGTNASTEALLLAVLPILLAGPPVLFALRDMKNARRKASNVSGILSLLWILFAIGWLLFEPLASKWGERLVYQQMIILGAIMIAILIGGRKQLWSE